MKTLQNDLTTIEQSKRLLELGVPKNSANHYYGKDGKLHYIDGTIPYSLLWETGCTPCWSVGRLMEIDLICRNRDYYLGRCLAVKNYDIPLWENGNYSICDYCVDEFIARIELGDYDFSKLED